MIKTFLPALLLGMLAMAPAAAPSPSGAAGAAEPAPRVLRLAFADRENNFDPAQVSDVISAAVVGSLYDAPLTYDFLARPVKLKPNTAVAMPEVHDDHKRFVLRIRPGVHFGDHPAFGGKPRELTAADYVYSIKRYYDPAVRSPTVFHYLNAGVLGLAELRQKAIDTKAPFEYDTPVEGLRVVDRYTFEVRLAKPGPRFLYVLASPALAGALAREVVEAVGQKAIGETPVGTGPFKLGAWKRGARIVLDRNPAHRHRVYDEQPAADDKEAQAFAANLRGRALPLLDRVEINIVEEAQPRWLTFLNRQVDLVALPNEFSTIAAPNGLIAPHLAKQGVQLHRMVVPMSGYTYFGMENPVVGGYTPDKVALRRAIALAYDVQREIDLVRRGQALPAQSVMPPGVSGYDAGFRSEMSQHDLPRAKALLEMHGYVDRDGDGWRERPDGSPLVLEYTTEPHQVARQLQELWRKSMTALGVRIEFRTNSWQENIKASRAGKLMMWGTGWVAALPDGSYFLEVLYGPNKGQANHSRFDLAELNALHERQRTLPDGPERDALIRRAMKLSVAYMPFKVTAHRIDSWVSHGNVVGYKPHPYIRDYWRYLDVEPAASH